jgi:hypothetical protein
VINQWSGRARSGERTLVFNGLKLTPKAVLNVVNRLSEALVVIKWVSMVLAVAISGVGSAVMLGMILATKMVGTLALSQKTLTRG